MKTIKQVIDGIIAVEGEKYTNHPADRGGPTKWGITQAALSLWLGRKATVDEVRNLTRATAYDIYHQNYIVKPKIHLIHDVSPLVAGELADTGVNMGIGIPGRFLQDCLNCLNREQKLYPDLVVDGIIGPATARALSAFKKADGTKGEIILLKMLNCLQGARYIEITKNRPANEAFVRGWFDHRISL